MARPTSRVRKPISEAVIRLREALGENQQQFANRLGTAITTIARYETSRPPSGQILLYLARLAVEYDRHEEAILFRESFQQSAGLGPPQTIDEVGIEQWALLAKSTLNLLDCARMMFWELYGRGGDKDDPSYQNSIAEAERALGLVGLPQSTTPAFISRLESMLSSGMPPEEWRAANPVSQSDIDCGLMS